LNRFALVLFISGQAPGGTFSGLAGEIPLSVLVPQWNGAKGKMLWEERYRPMTATNA
jgi:hypothetical protein